VQGTNLVLSWTGLPGVTYFPYYSTNLLDWLPYDGFLTGTNGPMQLIIPLDNQPANFFRLRVAN
jgi:hypothetical protein